MNSPGRKRGRRARRASPRRASSRSPLTALIVALSLFAQLVVVPFHRAADASEFSAADAAAIAADLKATFGDAAALCVQFDDRGAPAPLAPAGHCDDQCPLCRSAAQAAAFVPPDTPAVPTRPDVDCRPIGAAPRPDASNACASEANRARAPPLSA